MRRKMTKALVTLEIECNVDEINGDSEHVWVKVPKEESHRRRMVDKSKVTYPKEEQQKLEGSLKHLHQEIVEHIHPFVATKIEKIKKREDNSGRT